VADNSMGPIDCEERAEAETPCDARVMARRSWICSRIAFHERHKKEKKILELSIIN